MTEFSHSNIQHLFTDFCRYMVMVFFVGKSFVLPHLLLQTWQVGAVTITLRVPTGPALKLFVVVCPDRESLGDLCKRTRRMFCWCNMSWGWYSNAQAYVMRSRLYFLEECWAISWPNWGDVVFLRAIQSFNSRVQSLGVVCVALNVLCFSETPLDFLWMWVSSVSHCSLFSTLRGRLGTRGYKEGL